MSYSQSSLPSETRQSVKTVNTRSPIGVRLIVSVALLALGAALFGLGIFHGFENGSCSTTGYSAHYGPVQHCGKGTGWWMLMLFAGLAVASGGAVLSGTGGLAGGALFVAIGAPFVALALRSGSAHLLLGSSASTGRLFAGIFGACFVISGLVWGVVAAAGSESGISSGSGGFGSLLAAAAGVGVAFVIAAGVASAIGPSAPTGLQALGQGVTQSSSPGGQTSAVAGQTGAAAAQTSAALKQANAAITQARTQTDKATRLAACVTAAGTNNARIQACEAGYLP